MSKSDELLNNIKLDSAYKAQTKPKWASASSINAFDTETHMGSVFMVSYAYANGFSSAVGNSDGKELDSSEIFDVITKTACRSNKKALNVWYNLDFDANAILSGVLSDKELAELTVANQTTTEIDGLEYEITYIKGKFLNIEDIHGNIYNHYDISQFFFTSLDNAAEEWLGRNKIDKVDTEKFGANPCSEHMEVESLCSNCWSKQQALDYIKEHYSTIRKYAVKDAELTQELAVAFINEAEDLNIPMGRPISTGYVSAEFQRANTEEKPKFGSNRYQGMMWASYYGGRFEVFERGNVGPVAAPDINSAYPAVMRELPDPSTLDWQAHCNVVEENREFTLNYNDFDFTDVVDADYGVVRVNVTTDHNEKIQPFARKPDGKVSYPILTETDVTVIKPLFEFAVTNGLVKDFKLKEAWLGYETDITSYPFTWIDEMYADRKVYEVLEGKPKKGHNLKIVLNSTYGKTCQTTDRTSIRHTHSKVADKVGMDSLSIEERYELNDPTLTESELKDEMQGEIGLNDPSLEELGVTPDVELEYHESIKPKNFLSSNQRELLNDSDIIIDSQAAGRRFNPFIATYITGMTRLELHKQVVENDLVEDTVMFATDCIMVKKDAYDKSDFDELIQTPDSDLEKEAFRESAINSLGKWDFDYKGKAFIVGSGVYEVEFETCQNKGCEHYDTKGCNDRTHYNKTKTRGFTERDLPTTLKEMARQNPMGIPIEETRPLSMAEVLIKPERGNVSQFIKHTKKISPTFDTKREWQHDDDNTTVDFLHLLHNSETSDPIHLVKEQQEKALAKAQKQNNERYAAAKQPESANIATND